MPLTRRAEIWARTMEDVKDADIIMIAAGASQKPGQTRLDLLKENARIVGDIAEEAGSLAPDAVFLVTTNPVDVMTYVTMARSGVHHSHVIGSGTALDTARLRYMISRRLGIDPRSVHAYVVGEHGDSEVVAWSRASVAGTGIDEWPELCEETRSRISDDVKMAAYDVIEKKGATYYAIATALSRITEAILKDTRTVFSVSSYLQGEYGVEDVYMGVPSIVGREGVLRTIEVRSPSELRRLRQSAHVLRKAVDAIDIESMRQLSRGRALAGALSGSKSEASNEFITGRDLLPTSPAGRQGTIRAIRPRRQMKNRGLCYSAGAWRANLRPTPSARETHPSRCQDQPSWPAAQRASATGQWLCWNTLTSPRRAYHPHTSWSPPPGERQR